MMSSLPFTSHRKLVLNEPRVIRDNWKALSASAASADSVHLLHTLLIGCRQLFSSHLLFSPPSSTLSGFSPSFVSPDHLKSIPQTPPQSPNPRAFQDVGRRQVVTHAGSCVSVSIPRELLMLWADSHRSRSQVSSGPWETNNLSHLAKTWAKPPLICLSGQITNGYWLYVAGASRGVALSSSPGVPVCPLLSSWGSAQDDFQDDEKNMTV